MSRRFIITETEKKHIKNLYNISEQDLSNGEKIAKGFLELVKQNLKEPSSSSSSSEPSSSSSSSDSGTSDTKTSSVQLSDIKGLNSNEQIVLKQLKEDGYTDEAAAAVMGVVGGESGFKTFKETSYRTTPNNRIRTIFSSKLGKYSDEQLNSIKQSDEAFFNAVYGGMYGNAPNEGYKYVGRGFNGITFKGNYETAKKCTGIDFVSNPELMEDPKYAAKALSCYFKAVKGIDDFEQAFREAFRQNAGPGNSWEYYANSTNPVAVTGIPLKRGKGDQYYKLIKNNLD